MNVFTRTALLVAGLSVVGSLGCAKSPDQSKNAESKSAESKATATKAATSQAKDTKGLAQETLLVLKFHHDN
jgi:hypothetical protein